MKLNFKYILGVALAAPLIIIAPVLADNSSTTSSTGQTQTTTDTETDVKDNTTLEQRIEKHKNDEKIKLTTTETTKLLTRCKPAQAVIKNLGDHVNANVPERVKAYDELNQHLTDIISKLNDRGIDTTQLQAEQKVLAAKITTFKKDLATYKQALSDLNAMDCAKDPTGFKAALLATRALRQNLTTEIADIRTYVMNTIKPTLVVLRKQLADKLSSQNAGSNSSNEGSN